MVAEVSTVQATKTEKVYSQDGILYSGMTVLEAGKNAENMKVFDYADKDKDGVISDSEFNRYNGPTLVENTQTKQTRAYKDGYADIFPSISAEEVEYYPDLKIEQVNDKGRVTFTKIDRNQDGVLSSKELQNAISVKEKINNTMPQMKHEAKGSLIARMIGGVLSTTIGIGGVFSAFLGCVKYFSAAYFGGLLALFIGCAIGIGTLLVDKHRQKQNAQKNIEHNENLAKQLEEEYKQNEYAKQIINNEFRPHITHQHYE